MAFGLAFHFGRRMRVVYSGRSAKVRGITQVSCQKTGRGRNGSEDFDEAEGVEVGGRGVQGQGEHDLPRDVEVRERAARCESSPWSVLRWASCSVSVTVWRAGVFSMSLVSCQKVGFGVWRAWWF